MDVAIIERTLKDQDSVPELRGLADRFTKVDEIPFDFERRRMSVVVQNGKTQMITKGAVGEMLSVCSFAEYEGNVLPLTDEIKEYILRKVYPLIPLYLTTAFGATPAMVCVIEGVAESLASLLKVFSGYITDKHKKKKVIAFSGYATGIIYKLALLLAGSWLGILSARVIDRIGKGIRTAPRDVLVSESADKNSIGKAFGFHKALDMAALKRFFQGNIKTLPRRAYLP